MDDSVYRHEKSKPLEIFSLSDPQYNYCKLSLGAIPDFNHNYIKRLKMMFQHHYQSAIISILNCIFAVLIIYYDNNKSNLLNFMSVSWIIGSFCDNITSYKYHYTIDQYYKMLDRFNMYRRNYSNNKTIKSFGISNNTLQFNNVTFNYITDLFADVVQLYTTIHRYMI